jgi:hypothetical protein
MTHGAGVFAPRRSEGLFDRLRALLDACRRRAEPIELVEQQFNYLPRTFRWHGRLWRVQQILGIHEQRRAEREGRRYFRVRCQDDRSYLLYQDLHIGTWHVSM